MKSKYKSLFEIPNGVIAWLEDLTDNVLNVNPLDIFKRYRPLDRGNSKLNPNILSFSLPSISTCGQYCEGCYDVKSFRHSSVRKKRYVNYSMAVHNPAELEASIIKQINNSRTVDFIRLHVGGEFFNIHYVKMWKRIVESINKSNPDIRFYTYTKSIYTKMLKESGINVVKSSYDEGFNYGDLEYVREMSKKYKGTICPVTVMASIGKKVPEHYCGKECVACMFKEKVFFVKH